MKKISRSRSIQFNMKAEQQQKKQQLISLKFENSQKQSNSQMEQQQQQKKLGNQICQKPIQTFEFLNQYQIRRLIKQQQEYINAQQQQNYKNPITLAKYINKKKLNKKNKGLIQIQSHQILNLLLKQSNLSIKQKVPRVIFQKNKYKILQDLKNVLNSPLENKLVQEVQVMSNLRELVQGLVLEQFQYQTKDYGTILDKPRKYRNAYNYLKQILQYNRKSGLFWLSQNLVGGQLKNDDQVIFLCLIKRGQLFTKNKNSQQLIQEDQQIKIIQHILQIIKFVIASQFMDKLWFRQNRQKKIDNLFQSNHQTQFENIQISQQKTNSFVLSKKCFVYIVNSYTQKEKVQQIFYKYLKNFDNWFKRKKTVLHIIGFFPMTGIIKKMMQGMQNTSKQIKNMDEKIQNMNEIEKKLEDQCKELNEILMSYEGNFEMSQYSIKIQRTRSMD